jgi:hypothetical protein
MSSRENFLNFYDRSKIAFWLQNLFLPAHKCSTHESEMHNNAFKRIFSNFVVVWDSDGSAVTAWTQWMQFLFFIIIVIDFISLGCLKCTLENFYELLLLLRSSLPILSSFSALNCVRCDPNWILYQFFYLRETSLEMSRIKTLEWEEKKTSNSRCIKCKLKTCRCTEILWCPHKHTYET